MQSRMASTNSISTTMKENMEQRAQPLAPLMRWWFLADMVLVLVAGVQLFGLSESTIQFFAWTIKSTLTAAFLGAAYWSTLPMLWNSFRAHTWANARVAVPGVWVFTVLTLIATFQFWDKFHWSNPLVTAQFAFWFWLVIYVTVPVALIGVWFVQRRVTGVEPARTHPFPNWFRAALGAQALVLFGVGAAFYFFSSVMIPLWLWTLTPLTSAAIGAWCIGIGITTAWGIWENDARRLRGAMLTYALLGALQLIAVARYAGQINWNNTLAFFYLAFLVSVLVMGALGYAFARRAGAFANA